MLASGVNDTPFGLVLGDSNQATSIFQALKLSLPFPMFSELDLCDIDQCQLKSHIEIIFVPYDDDDKGSLEQMFADKQIKRIAIYNVPDDKQALLLLQRGMDGSFYLDDTLDTIVKGACMMLNDERWFKRQIIGRYISQSGQLVRDAYCIGQGSKLLLNVSECALKKRNLLVFTTHAYGSDLQLDKERWQTLVTDDLDTAKQLIEEYQIQVAIYDFSQTETSFDIELFIDKLYSKHNPMYWIALVRQDQLNDPQILQHIATLFYDYHTVPLHSDVLLASLGHAYGMVDIAHRSQLSVPQQTGCHGMVGNSEAMRCLFSKIDKISDSLAPVLIIGESGTGKELVAQAIHANSGRRQQPIIEVNCGAMSRDLIQSELFGHEKGAFTGANQRKIGSIEAADGGTLFLDEIGDLPLELQVNLLRFVQEGVIKRVGSNEKIVVDVRIISATHINLEEKVKAGLFREDLYYRLNVLHLQTPPLRECNCDITLLANVYLAKFRTDTQRQNIKFGPSALVAMQRHNWSGNVRELINRVRRAIVMSEGPIISAADLDLQAPEIRVNGPLKLDEIRNDSESSAIIRALMESDYNVTQAAKLLDISRRSLYRLMDKHAITPALNVVSMN